MFICAAMILAAMVAHAQNEPQAIVRVVKFQYTSDFGAGDAAIVRNNVITALGQTKRITLVDAGNEATIEAEVEARKKELAMGDNREVAEIVRFSSDYLLTGILNNISVVKKLEKDVVTKGQKEVWTATLYYTIQLVNPANGATISSFPYTATVTSFDGEKATRDKAINESSKNMTKFIEEAFPVKGHILMADEVDPKKNEVKSVFIDLGTVAGVQRDTYFDVYEVKDIAGERSEMVIGAIKAVEVLSDSRTKCKVTKGNDVITKLLADGKEVSIKSRPMNTVGDKSIGGVKLGKLLK